jgi:energy-coupling factor transport system ATP-binding protein
VGPSGSGKSTLARAIAGLLAADVPGDWQGSLRVGETDARSGALRGRAGIVFQDPASQLVMERAGDDVAFGLENLGWPVDAMRRRVPSALAEVGLGGFEERVSNRLSGGEQQRLALAGVEAPAPGLLVLDEPTANLDPAGAAGVTDRLAALRAGRRTTIVLIEHRVALAWPLADLVLALDGDGCPIDVGPAADVLARSASRMSQAGIWLPDDAGPPAAGVTPPPDGAEPVLEMLGVRFGFQIGVPVIRELDLFVGAGERVALVGPNGSGKTTLLRLALGLLRPSLGVVSLGGRDPGRLRGGDLAALAGYVVQDPELGFVGETVEDEVVIGLGPADALHAEELAAALGLPLDRFGARSPYRLSGGEQRRLSLVTALARRPRLLALDEPTYGQDRHGHEALVRALDELVGSGTAVLAATHDERFVGDAIRRRVELADGWIVAIDGVPAASRP